MNGSVRGPALLFCPGDRPDRFDKALAVADSVILDLEDGVGPASKDMARAHVVEALSRLDRAVVLVRVNAVSTPWHADDLAALAPFRDVVVILPMATAMSEVEAIPHPVVALCETARGILNAPGIASAANCAGVMWGSEDLVADLGGRRAMSEKAHRPAVEEARTRVLYAARAAGVTPIDTPFVDIADMDRLAAESDAAVGSGYAAKACIHPTQVATVRAAFRPTDEETRWARDVISAAAEVPRGVFTFEGRMIDAPVLAHASNILRQTQ